MDTPIETRAAQLRSLERTPLQAFRLLRNEFPHAERDVLVNAARLPGHHIRCNPSWAIRIGVDGKTYASGGFPVTIRNDPRKF